MIEEDRSLFFIEKRNLLETIDRIYDCLIELATNMDSIVKEQVHLKHHLQHLKHIFINDLKIHKKDIVEKLKMKDISMTVEEWNKYLDEDEDDEDEGKV